MPRRHAPGEIAEPTGGAGGRTVVITGAGGGIGRVLVEAFRANGDTVIAVDLRQESLDQFRDAEDVRPVAADITDDADCQRLAGDAGPVDVLVHGAGFMPVCPFEALTPADWRQCIEINLTGPFLVTRALLPVMGASGWGRLIFISSGTIFRGPPNQAHYIAAKAGLIGLSRSLATKWARAASRRT